MLSGWGGGDLADEGLAERRVVGKTQIMHLSHVLDARETAFAVPDFALMKFLHPKVLRQHEIIWASKVLY